MKRPRNQPPRIVESSLRDQASAERIDRVWERLERGVALGHSPRTRRAPSARSAVTALALAAGFALGLGAARLVADRTAGGDIQLEPAPTHNTPLVFAATDERATYALPGGGELLLEPESIVDTVSRGEDGLTLRLVRGQATLVTHPAGAAGRTSQLALQIGIARVTTSQGSVRVTLDGDQASLVLLDGAAAFDSPADGQRHQALRRSEPTEIPIRVVTARVREREAREPQTTTPEPVPPAPAEPSPEPVATGPVAVVGPPPVSPLAQLCEKADYQGAVKVYEEAGGRVEKEHLLCISYGYRDLNNGKAAIDVLERVRALSEPGSVDRQLALNDLADIYEKDPDPIIREKGKSLRGDSPLAAEKEPTVCAWIQAENAAGNATRVRVLAADYVERFPDGPCMDTIEKLLAALPKEEPPAEPPPEQPAPEKAP
jgi:hypothetical protein